MTKVPSALNLRAALLGLSFTMVLLAGCGTTSQPERPVPQVLKLPVLPEKKTESSPVSEPSLPAKKAEAEVDEKMSIFFAFGSSAVGHAEKLKLRDAASLLKEDVSLSVTLNGHANDNGSRSVNLAVADARVEAVAASLRKLGVKTRQIRKNVIGGEKPLNNCGAAECRQKMRRVELVFSKGGRGSAE